MYARMMEISGRLDTLVRENRRAFGDYRVHAAQQELYRGQCNCSYWHGAFGGLYLPHLRSAIYAHLIKADNLLDQYENQSAQHYATSEVRDFDFDGRPEVKLASDRLVVYAAPHRGGHLEEFDVRSVAINLGASLTRRPEAYHHKIRNAQSHQGHDQAKSIHDRIVFKQEGLDRYLTYDNYPRKCLVDRFLPVGTTLDQYEHLSAQELGDFIHGKYEFRLADEPDFAARRLESNRECRWIFSSYFQVADTRLRSERPANSLRTQRTSRASPGFIRDRMEYRGPGNGSG